MFVVECNADVALVETLTSPSRRNIKHAGCKSMVIRKLMRTHENSIGIIDQDPYSIQPKDIERFNEIEYSEKNQLRILYHSQRNNNLIILCPRLEEWIIDATREVGLDLNRYNLPNNPSEFHAIINLKINRFTQLVEDLKQRSDRLRTLHDHLILSEAGF